jgi:cytochrome c oxidase cbb3-type subunit 2
VNAALATAVGAVGLLTLAGSLLVGAPYAQLRGEQPPPGLHPYTAEQARGRAEYVQLGCIYCHSQQPRDPRQAPDQKRGWGRPSVPADYAYDYPHLLGTMRTGPDLFNIGARQPSRDWQLLHLYDPRAVTPGSIMPAHRFLFDAVDAAEPGDVVVNVPADRRPEGKVIVARPEALDLVAYLLALDHTYPVAPAEGGTP